MEGKIASHFPKFSSPDSSQTNQALSPTPQGKPGTLTMTFLPLPSHPVLAAAAPCSPPFPQPP